MSRFDKITAGVSASGALDRAASAKRKAKVDAKRERRKAKAVQSAAVEAANWSDREGKARPTPERLARGSWGLLDGEDAGVTVAVDRMATRLDWLSASGAITADQCQGGQDFAALMRRMQMVGEGRSCIDFSPVGFDDGDSEPSHSELRDKRDRTELYLACGMATWAELRRVCVEQEPPRSVDRLRIGLDLCVKFWA